MSRRLELMRLLDGFTPTACERRAMAEMRAIVTDPRDILSAYTYDPGHFTVSAFVTDRAMSKLVLIRHSRVGAWLQPGGHIEPSDSSLESAARREICEETGLTQFESAPGFFDVDSHRVPAYRGQPSHRHFDLRFRMVASDDSLAPPPGGDEVAWVVFDDVPSLTADRSVLRSLQKLLGP